MRTNAGETVLGYSATLSGCLRSEAAQLCRKDTFGSHFDPRPIFSDKWT